MKLYRFLSADDTSAFCHKVTAALNKGWELHGGPTLFSRLRQFPAPEDSELPLSPEAERFYRSGAPFLQRYLPYWAANLADRLFVMLLPAVAVLFPVMRLLPAVYSWRVRSRIYRWYGRLKEMELELDERLSQEQLEAMLRRLDEIDDAVSRIDPPLAYSENLYVFRQHIDLVRERTLARIRRAARSVSPSGQAVQARAPLDPDRAPLG